MCDETEKSIVMKKILFTLVCLNVLMGLSAQNNPINGDFELWSYGKPVGWTIGLHGNITSYINIPVEVNFGTQTNVAHDGNSAIKLQSADFTIPYVDYSANLPGILQAGESEGFSIPLSDILAIVQALQDTTGMGGFDPDNLSSLVSLLQLLSKGIPCTATPPGVSMWVKYEAEEDDHIMVVALTKQNGMVVDYAYEMFGDLNSNNYVKIGMPFENAGAPCDSIMLIVLSSTRLNSSSVLYVDDVELKYTSVGVDRHEALSEEIYPNPTSDVLNIEVGDGQEYQWTFRDLTGRTLQSGKGAGKSTLNVKDYPSGIYMLTLNVNGSERTRKVVVR